MDTLHISFKELFDTDITDLKEVVIPKIQRAYAQGRTDSRTTRTRDRFLDAIHSAIITQAALTLDFIYGNCRNGILIPLDGQQRLTTLFLLHWYAAKKGNLAKSEYTFLKNFRYETRYSAREFCTLLIDFNPQFEERKLSFDIEDQHWFPLDWKHDATINAMLVMIDTIDEKFHSISNLWQSLDLIKFYFLPIEEMGLNDDIYIKMNSRGKPLTEFEHFKAELEKTIKAVDSELADKIIHKIDIDWTDMLWPYRGNNNIIDDEFLRYFRFICDILCYRAGGSPKQSDEFKLLEVFFTGEKCKENVAILQSFFDCWKEVEDIDGLFNKYISRQHEKGKIKLVQKHNYKINLLDDCLNNYADVLGNKNRKFPLNEIILLYAFVIYLQNKREISEEQFAKRLRIIYNLILNSSDEISDSENRVGGNRMPAIIKQVDSIITSGIISENIVIADEEGRANFNVNQLDEERRKQQFLSDYPELSEKVFTLEDHDLLYGQISIVGWEHTKYFEHFAKLFDCDWDKIDCALLSKGHYYQRQKWWIQLGTKNRGILKAWDELFHKKSGAKGYESTKKCLATLLDIDDISDAVLDGIANQYISECEERSCYDWRYYYIKYPSFRIGRYGRYSQVESKPYMMTSIYASQYESSNSKQLFLNEIGEVDKAHSGSRITIDDTTEEYIRCENSAYVVYDIENNVVERFDIPQNKDGIDTVNRIIYGREKLNPYL